LDQHIIKYQMICLNRLSQLLLIGLGEYITGSS